MNTQQPIGEMLAETYNRAKAMRRALEHILAVSADPCKYGRYLTSDDRDLIKDALKAWSETPFCANPQHGTTPNGGSEVWLRMNLKAYAINTAIMFPVVVVMYAGWNVPPMPWICGITTGLWLGMTHNVIWGMLVWQRPPNEDTNAK